jgi:hypothetical protein
MQVWGNPYNTHGKRHTLFKDACPEIVFEYENLLTGNIGRRAFKMTIMPERKKQLVVLFLILLLLGNSCVSGKAIQGVSMTAEELEMIKIIGFVETHFTAPNGTSRKLLLQKGYNELLKIAQNRYDGKIVMRNAG